MAIPKTILGDESRRALVRGAGRMADLLRLTLGPVARTVVIDAPVRQRAPEVLDSAATIARRTYAIADRSEDAGAMLIRHVAWRVFQETGDGAATAAVLTDRLLREADRLVTAGLSPLAVGRGIEAAQAIALAALREQRRPLDDPALLARLLLGTLREPALADLVAEVVDAVGGTDSAVMVEDAYGTETTVEYVEGVRWDSGWLSSVFQPADGTTLQLSEPVVFVADAAIASPDDLLPALEAGLASGVRSFVVVAPGLSEAATALLLLNRDRGAFDGVVAIKAPSSGVVRSRILGDIAVQTGGRCLRPDAGDRWADVTPADLGRARLAWVRRGHFGIVGGRGDRAAIRARIAEAKAELARAGDDAWLRARTQERIGKLAGAAATILVGAATESARNERKRRVEAAVATARAAVRDGVVAGGGAAYVACASRIEAAAGDCRGDEAAGMRALAAALTEPMAAIATNAGRVPGPLLAEARRRGLSWTFDVLTGAWVEAECAGILDPLPVLETALVTGVSAAATALTVGAIVHRRHPEEATEP